MISNPNLKPSDRVTVLGVIDPDAYAAGTYTTGWVDMSVFESLLGIVMVGDFVSTGKADAKFEQATSSGGAGAKDVTGKSITQLTEAGTDSNKQVLINCQSEDLDAANSFRYARLSMTLTTAGADSGAILLGLDARYPPGTQATTVDETVG